MVVEVIPAILVKRKEDLLDRIAKVKGEVSSVHIDVMDNEFVPNKTIGPEDFEGLPEGVKYEFHWMVKNPAKWIGRVKGDNLHVVHIEAVDDWDAIKRACKKVGGRLGVAISPATPVSMLEPVLGDVEHVLVMSVVPGFSGQGYMPEVEAKIRELRKRFPKLDIEVDGGISPSTAAGAHWAGANKLAASSAIYSAADAKGAIRNIKSAAKRK